MSQLTLFETSHPVPPDPAAAQLQRVHQEARVSPAGCRATSVSAPARGVSPDGRGWCTFEPAAGLTGPRRTARVRQHPLLTTVGVDRSYYAPIPFADLRDYATQLPDSFRCCFKAPAAVTALALGVPGQQSPNPDFLSVDRLSRICWNRAHLLSRTRRPDRARVPAVPASTPARAGRLPCPPRCLPGAAAAGVRVCRRAP